MGHFLDVVKTVVEVFFAIGGGFGLSSFLKKNAALQKNERIKAALTFASQAVLQAQAFLANGTEQQESAAISLKQRLDATGMGKHFTEEQILAYIKSAYAQAKADGTLAEVKPVVSEAALKEAEAVISRDVESAE